MFIKLVFKNITKNKAILISGIISIFLAIIVLSFSHFLIKNVEKNLLLQSLGSGENKFFIQNQKKQNLLDIFKTDQLQQIYNQLKSDPNITNIYGIYKVNQPTYAILDIQNIKFETDIFLFASDKLSQLTGQNFVPIGINPTVVNLYNSQIADPPILPKIDPNLLKTLNIQIFIGKNSLITLPTVKSFSGKITILDPDLPLIGFTIPYQIAKSYTNELKLIKIIGTVKDPDYILKLKKKYPHVEIISSEDIKLKIKQKIKGLQTVLVVFNLIILIFSISFLTNFALNIYVKYQNSIKTLFYHKASDFKQFGLILGEIIIVQLTIVILTLVTLTSINLLLPQIEYQLQQKGYFIKLYPFDILQSIIYILIFSLLLTGISFYFFKKYQAKRQK